MERVFYGLIVTLLIASACGGGSGNAAASQIRTAVEKMADAGIECTNLVVDDPEADGSDGILGVRPDAPAATKVGYCRLEGAPEVAGMPIETRILVFEDDAHLDSIPPPQLLPGQALVYGETWEVYVVPAELGGAVQNAIGGELVEGSGEFPLDPGAASPTSAS
jgi:hypothetical protein